MKRLLAASTLALALAGCATANSPVSGLIYSNVYVVTGDVSVTVQSAEITQPTLCQLDKPYGRTKEDYLVVKYLCVAGLS